MFQAMNTFYNKNYFFSRFRVECDLPSGGELLPSAVVSQMAFKATRPDR